MLIVVQRPRRTIEITQNIRTYSACENCFGHYSTKEIWRHNCPASSTGKRVTKIILDGDFEESPELKTFFTKMRDDTISGIAKHGQLMLRFISQQIVFKGMNKYKALSTKVRILSSFLLKYHSHVKDSKASFFDVLLPQNIDRIKSVAMSMFSYDVDPLNCVASVAVEKPSSFQRLAQTLFQWSPC